MIKVTADVDETVSNAHEVLSILENRFLPQVKYRHPGLRYAIEGEGKEQKGSMADVIKGFAIAIFCIYALLAIPFKSFTQPFIVMALSLGFGVLFATMITLLIVPCGYMILNDIHILFASIKTKLR